MVCIIVLLIANSLPLAHVLKHHRTVTLVGYIGLYI